MGRFFRWLWTGFGTNSGGLQAVGITIIILLAAVWVVWYAIKFIVWVVTKISEAVKSKKADASGGQSAA